MSPRSKTLLSLLALYLAATCAGWGFARLGIPLPWMIGPLVLSAALSISGLLKVTVPVKTRPFGQMTIAAQVGLAFTPAALAALLTLAPVMIGTALASAACAGIMAILVARTTGIRLSQAFLSTFPTSPVEAAIMAERHGCDPAPVILAQTTRIAAVVILVPIAVFALDGWPDRSGVIRGGAVDPLGNGFLAFLAIAGALLFKRLGLSNPYFLGPLTFSAAASAIGLHPTAFPAEILSLAQIVLGTWLGSTFRHDLFVNQKRQLVAILLSTLVLLGLVSGIAVAIAWLAGQPWEVLVLGAAPGGVTEMALTAKFLGIDLALVTAFQLTRIFLFMPNIPWMIRMIDAFEHRKDRRG
ncbi:AbrB family transcriptional regulator [Tropicibacter sp. S64]|uniref:AbrB family transcriptional regulator n=1 Tax=Tropicibacter sp. S64 TaxID=3415122 RepID=UPI003C7CF2C5